MNYFSVLFNEIYKILFLLVPVLVSVAMIVWLDRRIWAFVQKRRGPNVVGPFGLFQSLADALKYIFKEKNLSKKYLELTDLPFSNEKLKIKDQDYYYSNSIARASKTMSDCRNSKNHIKATGTEG